VQAEMPPMWLFPQLLGFLLISVLIHKDQGNVPCAQRSSLALIVIFAFSTFETGHPAFASAAAF